MKRMSIFAIACGSILTLAFLLTPRLAWSGGKVVTLRIRVMDIRHHEALSGVRVAIDPSSSICGVVPQQSDGRVDALMTDNVGTMSVSLLCPAGGDRSMFGRAGTFVVHQEIVLEADGYKTVRVPIANLLGGSTWPLRKAEREVSIMMLQDEGRAVAPSK